MHGPVRPGDVVRFPVSWSETMTGLTIDVFRKNSVDQTAGTVTLALSTATPTLSTDGRYTVPSGYAAGDDVALILSVTSASGTFKVPAHGTIKLVQHGPTALPNAGAGATGGLPIVGTGATGAINLNGGRVDADIKAVNGSLPAATRAASVFNAADVGGGLRVSTFAATDNSGVTPAVLDELTLVSWSDNTTYTTLDFGSLAANFVGCQLQLTGPDGTTSAALLNKRFYVTGQSGGTLQVQPRINPAYFGVGGDVFTVLPAAPVPDYFAAMVISTAGQMRTLDSGGATLTASTLATLAGQTAAAVVLNTIAGYIDTEVAAIKAKTDNLPSDPADASDIAASFSSIASTLSTIASYIDTEVAAIKAKTDNLPASPATEATAQAAATQASAAATSAATAAANTGTINTKIGTPAGASVSADIAAVAASLASAGGTAGPGADSVTLTITNSTTGLALADADVWVSTDALGTNVVAGTKQTNSMGKVTFLLDAGSTYYLWAQKDGANSIRGQSFVAAAD